MRNQFVAAALCAAGGAWAAGTWQDVLQARDLNGDGQTDAYFDTDLNITWLRSASAAMYGGDARLFLDGLRVGGASGWRLATGGAGGCLSSSPFFDCMQPLDINSELGHMWYLELGGVACTRPTAPNGAPSCPGTSGGPFSVGVIWSMPGAFNRSGGTTVSWGTGLVIHQEFAVQAGVWAVHDGDVAAVPEPETWALMLAGLGVVGWAHRRTHTPNPARM